MPTATKQARARVPLTPLPGLEDADLVLRAREGDDQAFEEIVRRYRAPLIRYSARHVGRDHAEDVTQHALARAALHLRDDPRPIHLRAWLYRVAHNAAINMRARKDWGHEELSNDIDGVPQPPDVAAQRGEVRKVVSDLDRLPERQRTALVLSVFEGLGYDEIAQRLDTSPNSVRALISRARAQLRKAAAALAPVPLLQSIGRKISGLAGAAGTEGSVAAGSSLVQAKLIAIAATTVVAGAATAGRDTDADRVAAAAAPGAATAATVASGPDRVVPLNVDALIPKLQTEPKAPPAAAQEEPVSEAPADAPPPAEPVTEPPPAEPAPPAEEPPPAAQPPADPPVDDTPKDPGSPAGEDPPADPPPDEYAEPPPDDYVAPEQATLDSKGTSAR